MPVIPTLRAARAPIASFAAMGVVWGTFAAALPDIKTMLAVDEARLGALLFLTPIAAMAAMLAAPRYGAALGRGALPLSTLAMALALALPGQAASVWLFPVAMLAVGAATGLTDVLMNARVATLENARAQPLMNLCHAAYSFGYAGGALATGALRAEALPPGIVLGVMAGVAGLLALASLDRGGWIEGLVRLPGAAPQPLGRVPVIGGLVVLIAFLTENASEAWSALHIEQTLGGSPAEGAAGPAVLAITMGLARLGGQGLADRVNPARLLQGGAALSACGLLIAAAAGSPAMAYAGFIAMGIGASVIAPTAFTLVGRRARPEARARAIARATLLGYFGYFVGPPLLGFVAGNAGLPMAFVVAAGMLVSVLVLAPMLARD